MDHFDHSEWFSRISGWKKHMSMTDLNYFMKQNSKGLKTEGLEALLRRCDHDADRALSYDEFCDLTELPGGLNNDISIIHDAPSYMDSPDRKEVKDSVKRGTPHKRSNSNDQIDSVPKENIDESWKRREEERK